MNTANNVHGSHSVFFRLPLHVRYSIYDAAKILNGDAPVDWGGYRYWESHGVCDSTTQSCLYNLNHEKKPKRHRGNAQSANGTTYALLLTCRSFYNDICPIIYSTNKFYATYNKLNSLEGLRLLRPGTIAALRYLTLHLNETSCGFEPCKKEYRPWGVIRCFRGQTCRQEPLFFKAPLHSSESTDVISEWHQLWRKHLAPNLSRPPKLDFSLICDVADLHTARCVVQPLLEVSEPCIASCRIRLGAHKDRQVQRLAQQTVESLVPADKHLDVDIHDSVDISFRWMDLPVELRGRILEYTDLVTRHREVEWNPHHRQYYCRVETMIGPRDEDEVPISSDFTENVSRNKDCWRPEHLSAWTCWDQSSHCGCFCNAYHSAYSNIVRCRCWAPPTPLFLVCHFFRQDAIKIFFSQNRFVIAPECVSSDTIGVVDASPDRLAPSIFLSEVVPKEGLRYLRFLDMIFPAFGDHKHVTFCPPASGEYCDWVETLQSIKGHLNLVRLTVRVAFGSHPDGEVGHWGQYRRNMSEIQREQYRDCYVNTLAPLKMFRGLANFFVHLPEPQLSDWFGTRDSTLEQRIEKLVMGDDYEAKEKFDVQPSCLMRQDTISGYIFSQNPTPSEDFVTI